MLKIRQYLKYIFSTGVAKLDIAVYWFNQSFLQKKSKKKATASAAGSQMPGSKKPGDNSYVIPVPTAPVAPNCQQNNSGIYCST